MKTLLWATALTTLPVAALAADFQAVAPVTAATVYPQGATVTRTVTAQVPAGAHRILFPVRRGMQDYGPPRILPSGGVALGATQLLTGYVTDAETIYSPAQQATLERVESLEDSITAKADEIARAQVARDGANARLEFLASVKGGALDAIDPEALRAAAGLIGTETAAAQLEKQQTEEALRDLSEEMTKLKTQLAQAKADMARLTPPEGPVDMMAVSLELDAPQEVVLEVVYLDGAAAWRPDYDLRLTRGENASVAIDRKAVVQQYTGELWDGITLELSTADPFAGIVPSEPHPNQAQIGQGAYKSRVSGSASYDTARAAAEPEVMEEAMVEPVAPIAAGLKVEGLAVSYDYPRKVTLSPDAGEGLQLALDTVTLEADEKIIAAPRTDSTAFLLAELRNSLAEPILPGQASVYRDGVFVGRNSVPLIPAGAKEELSFGPLEAVRLEWKLLNNDTGDKGIVTRSNTREQAMEFTVENLSGEPVELTALYALPYSEQEDLELDIRVRPAPTREDWEKKRGVGEWDMELAPGEKKLVRIDVTLDWPTGSELIWYP
ncbi:DUF4139 domain-containing protein [Vannielia litorea]|uniref:DUF4139 domain-containing protein n=1 Tax=Vannielia litorea TaxID=1217970 RepID=UPI001C93780A|nr:DUF4139 domain-containing protein [Vannielia litorea]MBY6048838.1 DUF4139 domain-containing protein [Vannielia litorea]MBY6076252.1 DUF4139 domain-containing protein [Vannielia litorea]